MTFEETKFWVGIGLQVINALATVGVWLYVRYGDRNKEVDTRFTAIAAKFDGRADEHDRRLSRIEGELHLAPTHRDLTDIREKLGATTGQMREMAGQLQSMNDNLKLILNQIAQRGMQ